MKTLKLLPFIFIIVSCRNMDFSNNPYAELFSTHAASRAVNYKATDQWQNRIYPIDEIHIDFVKQLNEVDGFPNIPKVSEKTIEFTQMAAALRAEMNPEVNRLFDKYLKGIYICTDLGGQAITGYIYKTAGDEKGNNAIGGFIILDSSRFDKPANEWITEKEMRPFDGRKNRIELKIENERGNTVRNTLRYVLLKEFGYILGNTLGLFPDMRLQKREFAGFPLLNDIWIEKGTVYDKEEFEGRSKVQFYGFRKIKLDEKWQDIYNPVAKLPFPTLMSAMSPDEFVSEYFVSWVHVVLDKRPWELKIYREDKEVFSMGNGITDKRTEKYRKMLTKELGL